MNILLQKYFKNLEEYLIKSITLSGASSTDQLERGTAAEDFVAGVIESHLPKRAAVVTHRQIIGADSVCLAKRKPYGPQGRGPIARKLILLCTTSGPRCRIFSGRATFWQSPFM